MGGGGGREHVSAVSVPLLHDHHGHCPICDDGLPDSLWCMMDDDTIFHIYIYIYKGRIIQA